MAKLTPEVAVAAVNEVLESRRDGWEPVEPTTPVRDLDLDSLEVAELFAVLEERSGLELDPESAASLETVGDFAQLKPL